MTLTSRKWMHQGEKKTISLNDKKIFLTFFFPVIFKTEGKITVHAFWPKTVNTPI